MSSNHEEFLELYEAVHTAFSRFCHARAYGIMEPEDLMAETVLKALEKFDTLRNKEAFLSFLFSIASNTVNKKYRRAKFRGNYNEEQALSLPENGLDAETRMDIKELYQALETLAPLQKEAIILFEISGFSIKEIAGIQESGESAVKQRLRRGREKLGNWFKSDQLRTESIETPSRVLLSVFL